jgi:hypothetical protein
MELFNKEIRFEKITKLECGYQEVIEKEIKIETPAPGLIFYFHDKTSEKDNPKRRSMEVLDYMENAILKFELVCEKKNFYSGFCTRYDNINITVLFKKKIKDIIFIIITVNNEIVISEQLKIL